MFKTLDEVREHKNLIGSKGLQNAIIYFYSSLSNSVEERHIYADDYNEVVAWLQSVIGKYDGVTDCVVYLNGIIYLASGDIFGKIN